MNRKNKLATLALSSLILLSCSGEVEKKAEIETPQPCIYKYDDATTTVGWTAFKFTEKTGVNGVFNTVNVLFSEATDDLFKTLTGASFTIPVESVDSKNEDRDAKINAHFFGAMSSTDLISGLVKSINETEATIELTMNGMSKDYIGAVTVEGETIGFSATINLTDFEAEFAIDSLNTICKDLHTGTDGISKLWTEVDINVKTTLKKDCP
ncbi:MAG: YceI family protein [Crocinitomicaceae bacterium]